MIPLCPRPREGIERAGETFGRNIAGQAVGHGQPQRQAAADIGARKAELKNGYRMGTGSVLTPISQAYF
jgi:hypothetical protein